MSRRMKLMLYVNCLALVIVLAGWQRASSAALFSAGDLIAAVNALRGSQGLEAYQVDSGLMAYAQEHADYIASIGHGTHQHSDGSYPSDVGLMENVAEGTEGFLTIDLVVYTIWSDWVHMKTMVGYTSGQVGAGMAVKDGTVYYVLNVRGGEKSEYATPEPTVTGSPGGSTATEAAASDSATPAPYTFVPIQTNTPQADGSIVHIVKAGETLWSIALSYGVKVEELRWLNGMESDSNDIYVEQRLLIRPGYTETPTPPGGVTDTPRPTRTRGAQTSTPSQSPTPLPPTQTSTPAQAATTERAADTAALSKVDAGSLGLGVLAGILILLAVGANEFRRLRKR